MIFVCGVLMHGDFPLSKQKSINDATTKFGSPHKTCTIQRTRPLVCWATSDFYSSVRSIIPTSFLFVPAPPAVDASPTFCA
jgi:hypothetical protein